MHMNGTIYTTHRWQGSISFHKAEEIDGYHDAIIAVYYSGTYLGIHL